MFDDDSVVPVGFDHEQNHVTIQVTDALCCTVHCANFSLNDCRIGLKYSLNNSCSRAQYYDRNDARTRYAVVTPKRTREQHLVTRQCGYELAGRTARETTTNNKAPTPDTRRAARTDLRRRPSVRTAGDITRTYLSTADIG